MTPKKVSSERDLVEVQWNGALSSALLQAGSLYMESDEQQATTDTAALADKAAVVPEVVKELPEELTEEEASDRHRLELRVERAFVEAGKALAELRDRRLYRSTHKSWGAYCLDRFGYGRDSADLKILAAAVVQVLEQMPTNRRQILPTTLEQVRALTKLQPDEQREVWQQAVEEADGKVPSGRIVKGIVERLKQKPLTKATDFCKEDDVFTLTGLVERERKYNGCWAIAAAVKEFIVEVDVYDATLSVKPENLNPIDFPDVHRELPTILKRIRRLRDCGFLDRGAYNVLEDLGRHTYLTPVEERLLSCLEEYYGVGGSENGESTPTSRI